MGQRSSILYSYQNSEVAFTLRVKECGHYLQRIVVYA